MGVTTTNLVGNPYSSPSISRASRFFMRSTSMCRSGPSGDVPYDGKVRESSPRRPTVPNPFIDPQSYQNEVTIEETAFNNELKRPAGGGPPRRAVVAADVARAAAEQGATRREVNRMMAFAWNARQYFRHDR